MENFDLIGLLISIPVGIFLGHSLYKNYCKKRGIDFKTAMESNSYAIYQGSLVLTVFIYFLIKALLGY